MEKILNKIAKKRMVQWDLNDFKKTHPHLFETIIEAMSEVSKNLVQPDVIKSFPLYGYRNWFKRRKDNGTLTDVDGSSIPKGWYVAEAGQNPLHMLWFVVLINFDDVANDIKEPRHFVAEECDSFEQALQECIKNFH